MSEGWPSVGAELADRMRASQVCVCITAVPITKLFARGGGGMEDMCYERLRAKAGVN